MWDYPEGGQFALAVPGDEEIVAEVERFFGRELSRYNHAVFYEHIPYIVFFFFAEKSDLNRHRGQIAAGAGSNAIKTIGKKPIGVGSRSAPIS